MTTLYSSIQFKCITTLRLICYQLIKANRERKGEDSTIIKSQFLSMAYRDADINALIIFGDFIMTESPHDKHTNFVQYTYERKI